MKVLLVGVGGVGEAIAVIAQDRPWLEQMVLSDYNLERVKEVHARLHAKDRFAVERIDATGQAQIEALARKYSVDLIMNAVDPVFNEKIFDAACHSVWVTHGLSTYAYKPSLDAATSPHGNLQVEWFKPKGTSA